ncbi:membrane protein [Lysinibacillus sp. PLM2]|nr:membrane protein [Lysinibacillus sp. PLM2]
MTNKKYKVWPIYRIISFSFGILCIATALIGPIAKLSHTDFTVHMIGHLLLGMLGPLLIVISAPMTLLLRSLKISHARKVSKVLRSRYVQFISHPLVASTLNIGGLWILYTTDLYEAMHQSMFLYVLIHVHVFLAGYVFTASMIYIDPSPHRTTFRFRALVFISALAGHNVLSKWIYANPPSGVSKASAELGAMTMYYGGDLIDVWIIIIMCYQVYKLRVLQLNEIPSLINK